MKAKKTVTMKTNPTKERKTTTRIKKMSNKRKKMTLTMKTMMSEMIPMRRKIAKMAVTKILETFSVTVRNSKMHLLVT